MSSPYGPGQKPRSILPVFAQRVLQNENLVVRGQGTRSQDFIEVSDAAQAHIDCLLSLAQSPGIFNLGSGEETSMVALSQCLISAVHGTKSRICFDPEDGSDNDRFVLDITKIKELTGFSPMTLQEGIQKLGRDEEK